MFTQDKLARLFATARALAALVDWPPHVPFVVRQLMDDCIFNDPAKRPTAKECLDYLFPLLEMERSHEHVFTVRPAGS